MAFRRCVWRSRTESFSSATFCDILRHFTLSKRRAFRDPLVVFRTPKNARGISHFPTRIIQEFRTRGNLMPADEFVLGLVQMRCATDAAPNMEKAIAQIHAAAKRGAQIVILPELFLSPYFCNAHDMKC